MSFKKNINHIQITLKDNVKDVLGEKTAYRAKHYLNIDTGKIKTGKVFTVIYELSDEDVKNFAYECIRDKIINDVYINNLFANSFYKSYILVAKMPGVTDDEGISAQKMLADYLNISIDTKTQHIFTQNIYLIERDLDNKQLKSISQELLGNNLINHFEYGTFTGNINYIPEVSMKTEDKTEMIDLNINDKDLIELSKKRLLSLNLDEMKAIRSYYSDPETQSHREKNGISSQATDCEIEIFAQTWSEHCKHKEFNALIHYKNLETGEEKTINSLFKTYIKGSTDKIKSELRKTGRDWLVKVFSDNAGVVKIDDNSVFVWKVETHNSPSAIDPYGGAITGILGNNRDPLGTGRGGGRLLFNTNVLCFGSPFYDKKLLTGQLHPKRVFEGVRHGIEDGGNKSGIPTVNGSIIFDDRYRGKPLVYCGTGSIMPARYNGKNSWEKEIEPDDRIVMAGGRVGKDGIHGATFSSVEIDEHSPQSAVQIGSPITQKLLADFLEKATARGLVKCCTDNGAGGLSSSVGELAGISGGALVELERVPLKYSGLKPWEIFLSESQERMTLVVEENNLEELFNLAEEYETELSNIGKFTSSGYLDVRYNKKKIAYINIDFLHNGVPKKILEAVWEKQVTDKDSIQTAGHHKLFSEGDKGFIDYEKLLFDLLGSLNICSRESVIRQYDHEVKGKTVIKPLMGMDGKTPQDAAVLRLNFDSYEGVAVSNGIIPRYGDIDAYQMSAGAFDEAVRQIISVGGELPDASRSNNVFWSVNDNFCVPDSVYDKENNPDGKLKLAKLVQMCEALYDSSTYYNIPMTSGKDSMKNDFKSDGEKISVPPTILYSMVSKINDVRKTVTSNFKTDGDLIYLLGKTYNELGASELYNLFGIQGGDVPKVRMCDAKRLYELVMKANREKLIESSHDVSDGGMMITLVESAFDSSCGVNVDLENVKGLSLICILFSESHSRFIVSIKPQNKNKIENLFGEQATLLGKVTSDNRIKVSLSRKKIIDCNKYALLDVWNGGLEI